MRNRKRLPLWGLATVAGLLVETAAHASGSRPEVADRAATANCRLVGEVRGDSGFGKHPGAGWVEVAGNRALDRAAALGATHVVWEGRRARGVFNGRVDASAYACN